MISTTPAQAVQLSQPLLGRAPKNHGPDPYWRKRQILRMSAHFYGRARNCFSIAIRRVQRALQYVNAGRRLRKKHVKEVWEQRLTSGCQELGYIPEGAPDFLEALARCEIYLNRQSLSNLAIWEPRTFKAINKVAATKAKQEGINAFKLGPPPEGVYTRGKL